MKFLFGLVLTIDAVWGKQWDFTRCQTKLHTPDQKLCWDPKCVDENGGYGCVQESGLFTGCRFCEFPPVNGIPCTYTWDSTENSDEQTKLMAKTAQIVAQFKDEVKSLLSTQVVRVVKDQLLVKATGALETKLKELTNLEPKLLKILVSKFKEKLLLELQHKTRNQMDQIIDQAGDEFQKQLNYGLWSMKDMRGEQYGASKIQLANQIVDRFKGHMKHHLESPVNFQMKEEVMYQVLGQLKNMLMKRLGTDIKQAWLDQLVSRLETLMAQRLVYETKDQIIDQTFNEFLSQLESQLQGSGPSTFTTETAMLSEWPSIGKLPSSAKWADTPMSRPAPELTDAWSLSRRTGTVPDRKMTKLKSPSDAQIEMQLKDHMMDPAGLWPMEDMRGEQHGASEMQIAKQFVDQLKDQLKSHLKTPDQFRMKEEVMYQVRDQIKKMLMKCFGNYFNEAWLDQLVSKLDSMLAQRLVYETKDQIIDQTFNELLSQLESQLQGSEPSMLTTETVMLSEWPSIGKLPSSAKWTETPMSASSESWSLSRRTGTMPVRSVMKLKSQTETSMGEVATDLVMQTKDQMKSLLSYPLEFQSKDLITEQVLEQLKNKLTQQLGHSCPHKMDQLIKQLKEQLKLQLQYDNKDEIIDRLFGVFETQLVAQLSSSAMPSSMEGALMQGGVSSPMYMQIAEDILFQIKNNMKRQLSSPINFKYKDQITEQVLEQLKNKLTQQLGHSCPHNMDQLIKQLKEQLKLQLQYDNKDKIIDRLFGEFVTQLVPRLPLEEGVSIPMYPVQITEDILFQIKNNMKSQLNSPVNFKYKDQIMDQARKQLKRTLFEELGNQLTSSKLYLLDQLVSQLIAQLKLNLLYQTRDSTIDQAFSEFQAQLTHQLFSLPSTPSTKWLWD